LEEFEFFRSFRELFRGFFQPQKRLGSHIALVFAEGGIAEVCISRHYSFSLIRRLTTYAMALIDSTSTREALVPVVAAI
jgi:hypothetical protein